MLWAWGDIEKARGKDVGFLGYIVTSLVVRQLYYAFIYLKIKYGIELYGSSSASNMNKVQVIYISALFRNYFEIKGNSYDLRTRDQLTIPLTWLSLGQHAVRVKWCSLWNKIDKSLLNYRFKNTLKQHLTKLYLISLNRHLYSISTKG